MNKWEREVQSSLLDSEEAAIKELEKQYAQALNGINEKIKQFQSDISVLDEALAQFGLDDNSKALLESQKRAKIYQKQYQEALSGQVGGILDKMHSDNYNTINGYLNGCYETGYIGTMYDIAKQGVPIIAPINQAAAVKAVLTDSKVSKGLYTALGVNILRLKKTITNEISRGIASGRTYADIARNISNVSKAPLSRAKTIARTEGHRIQQTSTADAQSLAKSKGADVLKQWDATLDARTRDSHAAVDGEIKELDEKFSNGLMFPGDPNGLAAEVINCRCTSNTRARWALDEAELQTLKERAEYFGLDKAKSFEEFREKYIESAKNIENSAKSGIMEAGEKGLFVLNKNGDRVRAEIKAIAKEELPKMTESSGWRVNWKELAARNKIFGLYTEDGTLQSAMAARVDKDRMAVYANWIVNAPQNAPGAKEREFFNCGEPLLAKAITYSLDNELGGVVIGDASNKKLVKYYSEKWGAEPGYFSDSAFPVLWQGQSCINILRKYGYMG